MPEVADKIKFYIGDVRDLQSCKSAMHETIYHRLEKTEMDYEQWKKIDVLLPELPIEQSWDKCLRLKLAFKQ